MNIDPKRIERIARVIHAAEREYALSLDPPEDAQAPWEKTSERHKELVMEHVRFVLTAGSSCEAELFYRRFQGERQEAGPARGHVDWDELPVAQRLKYHLFVYMVAAFDL